MTDIQPRMIEDEPYCAPLTCPAKDTCIWRNIMNTIMSADAPCPPMVVRQRNNAQIISAYLAAGLARYEKRDPFDVLDEAKQAIQECG